MNIAANAFTCRLRNRLIARKSGARLATTVERWWPEIEGFLELGITNARTEGHNRVITQIKRVGCGFRNQAIYERRIMLHSATRRAA